MFKLFEVKKRTRKITAYSNLAGSGRTLVTTTQRRIKILTGFFVLVSFLIIYRLFVIQIAQGEYYMALASDQHEIFKQLYPVRGTIYAQELDVTGNKTLVPLAINRDLQFVYAIPKDIADPEAVTKMLMDTLDFTDEIKGYRKPVEVNFTQELSDEQKAEETVKMEAMADGEAHDLFYQQLKDRLSKKDDPFEPIKHRVSDEMADKLNSFNLKGIHTTSEQARYYPEKNSGSQLVGFVGQSSENNMLKGYYGIEGNLNKYLSGASGFLRSESDSAGRLITLASKEYKEAQDGSDVVLTIDRAIQFYSCERLAVWVNDMGASSGQVIVMNPKTGAILALCNYPDYDPNNYNKVKDIDLFNNKAINESYEPGSVFKPVTMAAALDSGKVTPFSGFNDPGVERIAGFNIMNSDLKAHGWQTMTGILELSLNTGTIYIARLTGLETFRDYVKRFGFGEVTNIELSPEAEGNISSLEKKGEIYLATGSFGQGLTVTPLQLAVAYSAIANGGQLVTPYVVNKIIAQDKTEQVTEPKIRRQVISEETSKQLKSMLVSVVDNGHAKRAQIKNYKIGGKTGTAQMPDTKNGGYSLDTIHTFAGFGPYNDPQFVIITKMDKVQKVEFAEGSVVPLFKEIAQYIIDYYGIVPEVGS